MELDVDQNTAQRKVQSSLALGALRFVLCHCRVFFQSISFDEQNWISQNSLFTLHIEKKRLFFFLLPSCKFSIAWIEVKYGDLRYGFMIRKILLNSFFLLFLGGGGRLHQVFHNV